jgi:site-specific DNA recombinase
MDQSPSKIDLTANGAVYLRVSTDKQDAERQRRSTSEWSGRHDVKPKVFEDIGWARDEADIRPEFQRLMQSVEARRISWIVVDALDRFGTKNKHQFISYIYRLQEAGCKLYTIDDKEWTKEDLITLLEAAFAAENSEKELRGKSERVLEGMREHAKEGMWVGGRVPYGMDVVAFRRLPSGLHEQWRVQIVGKRLRVKIGPNGVKKDYAGENNFPSTEADEVLRSSTSSA